MKQLEHRNHTSRKDFALAKVNPETMNNNFTPLLHKGIL
jgi:hypothetical protein